MLKNNKATVKSVNVVDYDEDLKAHVIKYELSIKSGIVRRRTILYSTLDDLSNDMSNESLVEDIKREIALFDKGNKSKQYH